MNTLLPALYRKFETTIQKMKLCGFVPNFHIHVSVSDLYIRIYLSSEYINLSQIQERGNWEQGRAVSFLGIHKSDPSLQCALTH